MDLRVWMARLVAGITLEGHAGIGEWGADQVLAAALLAPSAVAILIAIIGRTRDDVARRLRPSSAREMERGRTASSGCAS